MPLPGLLYTTWPRRLTRSCRWTRRGRPSDHSNQFCSRHLHCVSHLQMQQRPRQTCDTSLGDPRLRRQGHGRRSRVRRRIDSFEKLLLLHPTAPIVTLMRFWSRLSLNSLKSTLLSRLILFPSSFSLPPSLMSEKTEVTSMHTNTN